MEQKRKTIVAEISVNWPRPSAGSVLSQRFEDVIEFNRKRGYRLESWNFSQAAVVPGGLVETIIAVFKRAPAKL